MATKTISKVTKPAAGTPSADGQSSTMSPEAAAHAEWTVLLASVQVEATTSAVTFKRGPFESFSRPVVLVCSDGVSRMVKGKQAGGRALFNDQVVGRLASLIGAPVPPVSIVALSADLIAIEPRLQHMPPGLCHASEFIDECSDRLGVDHTKLAENRRRFARLAILYGWVHANDYQLIYPNADPRRVWSVDHGHFLGDGGPDWTKDILNARGPSEPEPWVVNGASLVQSELHEAALELVAVDKAKIAGAVRSAPSDWNVPDHQCVALCAYLEKRRASLLAYFKI